VSFAAITVFVAPQRVFYCCRRIFRCRLSPETFGYTLVLHDPRGADELKTEIAEAVLQITPEMLNVTWGILAARFESLSWGGGDTAGPKQCPFFVRKICQIWSRKMQ
jgi:hypothetical protein